MYNNAIEIWAETTSTSGAKSDLEAFAAALKAGTVVPDEYLYRTLLSEGSYETRQTDDLLQTFCTAPVTIEAVYVHESERVVHGVFGPTDRGSQLMENTALWKGVSLRFPNVVFLVTHATKDLNDWDTLVVYGNAFYQGTAVTPLIDREEYPECPPRDINDGYPLELDLFEIGGIANQNEREVEYFKAHNKVILALCHSRGMASSASSTH